MQKAFALSSLGMNAEAIEIYDKVLEINPTFAVARQDKMALLVKLESNP